MGKKRKHDQSEEELRRKIKKLQDRLTSKTQTSCPSENLSQLPHDTPYEGSLYCESPLLGTVQYGEVSPLPPSPILLSPGPASPRAVHMGLAADTPPPLQSPPPPPSQPGTSDGKTICVENTEELELDEDILQLLGDAPKTETPIGPSIHKDVARRWQDILAKGLSKEVKENLLKNYAVPSNCDLLLTPALNPEVKAALPEPLVKRDISLARKQKQLGIALSALATVTEMVISNETSKQKLLKPLSDACRILCDSHHVETRTRRAFVISSINTKLKDVLLDTNRGNLLFGDNISEKLKTAKTIQQSGDVLKNAPKPKFQRTNAAASNTNKGRLNYAPQHRKTDNKPNEGRKHGLAQRQPQNSSARRVPDRSLPGRTQGTHRR